MKKNSDYLVPRGQAHLVLLLLFLLMAFDYIDRQVLSALLPLIKQDWSLSDRELGMLSSAVNVAIAILALPTAVVIDRWSRSKCIGVMALVWSLATGACAFAGNFFHLLTARFLVGAGEAGYAAGGNALLSGLYPRRLRSTVIGIFQSASMIGAMTGVVLGGYIGQHWGWRHAFGIVAVPGFFLAVLAFFVRDYQTVRVSVLDEVSGLVRDISAWEVLKKIFTSPVLCVTFIGQAAQLFFASTLGLWLPSFFKRAYHFDLQQAGVRTGVIILMSALGVACCGYVIDRVAAGRPHRRLLGAAVISVLGSLLFVAGFTTGNIKLLFAGGFFMVAVLGPVMSAVIDFVHPGMRTSTSGAMVTATNLLGMTLGPLVSGELSDRYDLQTALTIVSFVPLLAAACYTVAGILYGRAREAAEQDTVMAAPI